MPVQRQLHTRPRKKPTSRFSMQMPDEEIEGLELTVARLQRLRTQGSLVLTKQPSAAKVVRLALRQLFGQLTTEQLAEMLEVMEL